MVSLHMYTQAQSSVICSHTYDAVNTQGALEDVDTLSTVCVFM